MNRFWFLFKSTAVRLSALYILLFAICAATLVILRDGDVAAAAERARSARQFNRKSMRSRVPITRAA